MNWIAVIGALRERAATLHAVTEAMGSDNPAKVVGQTTKLTLQSLAEALEVGTRTPIPRAHGYGPGWES